MIEIPNVFVIRECPECGLEHAPIRTCDDARLFNDINKEKK